MRFILLKKEREPKNRPLEYGCIENQEQGNTLGENLGAGAGFWARQGALGGCRLQTTRVSMEKGSGVF